MKGTSWAHVHTCSNICCQLIALKHSMTTKHLQILSKIKERKHTTRIAKWRVSQLPWATKKSLGQPAKMVMAAQWKSFGFNVPEYDTDSWIVLRATRLVNGHLRLNMRFAWGNCVTYKCIECTSIVHCAVGRPSTQYCIQSTDWDRPVWFYVVNYASPMLFTTCN